MSTFKEMLNEAIESVFHELDSMPSNVFHSEIEQFLHDKRTDAILYAWDSVSTECYDPMESCLDLKEMLHPLMVVEVCNKNIPLLLFDDQKIEANDHFYRCESGISSDDYFLFMAAA